MFESVKPVDSRLVIKLKSGLEQRSEKLLHKLARHLRERMPEISSIQYQKGTITQTVMVSGGAR